jgi:hypothetical protein
MAATAVHDLRAFAGVLGTLALLHDEQEPGNALRVLASHAQRTAHKLEAGTWPPEPDDFDNADLIMIALMTAVGHRLSDVEEAIDMISMITEKGEDHG